MLRDALPSIGDVQVRNRGTVGGAVAHADPDSDLPAALLALDAELVLQSARGTRTVKADGFFEGPFQTGIAPRRAPDRRHPAGAALRLRLRVRRPRAAGLRLRDGRGRGGDRRRGGGRRRVRGRRHHRRRRPPVPGDGVEDALVGTTASADVIAAAAAHAADGVTVNSDIHANSTYRAAMAAVIARRAIEAALARSPDPARLAALPVRLDRIAPGRRRRTGSSGPCSRATCASAATAGRRAAGSRPATSALAAAGPEALGARDPTVLVLEPGDLHEDEAALRLARRGPAGPGLEVRGPSESRVDLVAAQAGVLHVRDRDVERLDRIDPIEVFTALDGPVVAAGSSSDRSRSLRTSSRRR